MSINNPVGITNIGDPFVLKHEERYYLYATSFIDGFYVWVSDDMMRWKGPMQVYKSSPRSFGYKDFWAPEVIFHQGTFIMHYSARAKSNHSLRIGVATSQSPMGPFLDVFDGQPMFDHGFAAIDGHVFIDDDQTPYFYFDKDCSEHIFEGNHESHIYATILDDTLTRIKAPLVRVLKPEQPWEIRSGTWRWNEGAFMLKHEHRYYLMYSAGFYASKDYAIGYAVADHPFGPFVKADENPIISQVEGKISGPGHNSVVTGPDGRLYCVYHVHTHLDQPSENRQVFIDELVFECGKMKILGPTLSD